MTQFEGEGTSNYGQGNNKLPLNQTKINLTLLNIVKDEKSLLDKEAQTRGDIIIKGVKFHPELMPIESCFRNISKYMKDNNIVGTSRNYIPRIEASYSESNLTSKLIRQYFRACREKLQCYMEGATGSYITSLTCICYTILLGKP